MIHNKYLKMKSLTLITLLLIINTIQAQSFIKLKVPMVLENKKVDSLVDMAITEGGSENFCIHIQVHKLKVYYLFDVSGLKTNLKIIDLGYEAIDPHHMIPAYTDSLRFFKYKGYIVFISGATESFGLFNYTKTLKTLKFATTIIETEKKYPITRIFYMRYYNFTNGNFHNDAIGYR